MDRSACRLVGAGSRRLYHYRFAALPWLPFFPDYPAMQCKKYGPDSNQYCAALEIVRLGIHDLGEFFHGFESLLLVAVTGVIAYFTFALKDATIELKHSTDRLWKAGEDQREMSEDMSQRELRAYVGIDPKTISAVTTERIVTIKYNLRNNGHTPARDLHQYSIVEILPLPLPKNMKLPEPPADEVPSYTVSWPNATVDTHGVAEANRKFTAGDLAGIEAGTSALYVIIVAFYRDVFNEQRRTTCCAYVLGEQIAKLKDLGPKDHVEVEFSYTDQHNNFD